MRRPDERPERLTEQDGDVALAEATSAAFSRALRELNRRERTTAQVRSVLGRAKFRQAEVDAAIAQLAELGALDDARYARCFAHDRRALDGWGAERIRRRLIDAGIDPELAAEAAGGDDRERELESALALLRARIPVLDGERERQRALGVLVRRGYEAELAYEALRRHERGAERGPRR